MFLGNFYKLRQFWYFMFRPRVEFSFSSYKSISCLREDSWVTGRPHPWWILSFNKWLTSEWPSRDLWMLQNNLREQKNQKKKNIEPSDAVTESQHIKNVSQALYKWYYVKGFKAWYKALSRSFSHNEYRSSSKINSRINKTSKRAFNFSINSEVSLVVSAFVAGLLDVSSLYIDSNRRQLAAFCCRSSELDTLNADSVSFHNWCFRPMIEKRKYFKMFFSKSGHDFLPCICI